MMEQQLIINDENERETAAQENTKPSFFSKYSLQEYLSFGYIYLIVLGVMDNIIFYKFLGINIIAYLPISDVLLTPINTLVRDLRGLLLLIIVLVGFYYYYTQFLPSFYLKNKDKDWLKKISRNPEKTEVTLEKIRRGGALGMMVICFTFVFLGFTMGLGIGAKERLENGETKMSHHLTFNDNTTKRVKIMGQNSSYIFFVPEGEKEITIMPIGGNVKAIKLLKNKDGR